MSNIDCLLEVTARFFKAGEKTDENLEDAYCFTSYGPWLDDGGEEYWEFVQPVEKEKVSSGYLCCFKPEDREHYVILKDFIGFSFSPVFFGDFWDGRGSGIYFDDISLTERFEGCEDAFVEYARAEQQKYNEDRKLIKHGLFRAKDISEETYQVKFILALKYNVTCHPSGPWGPEEYDSEIEIAGKLDTTRIAEILI